MSVAEQKLITKRRKFIGGTDIAAIVGVSRWATPLSVYLDKIGEGEPQEETLAMRRGKWMERFISREFVREHPDLVVDLHPEHVVRDDWGFPAGASLDGLVRRRRSSDSIALFEAKNANAFRAKAWDEASGDLPDAYYVQVQWYLAVTGLPLAYAVADVGDALHLRTIEILPAPAVHERLIEAAHAFWCDHVATRVPPEPTGAERDGEIVGRLYPASDPAVPLVALPEHAAAIAAEACKAAAEEKAAAERKAAAQNRLKLLMGIAEAASVGAYRMTWKTQTRTTLDSKALRKAEPEVAARYERTSETRVFRLSEASE